MTGRVMEFDGEGNMVVNYSERLVALLRDTRQLTELGMAMPERIRRAAADAEKYYRYGVMLKKVRAMHAITTADRVTTAVLTAA
jgi:dynein heavy chain 2